jgi:hypothetical protein
VINIGGEQGTMGWVDLWRGILLCDVLRDEPVLRNVPLPFPKNHLLTANNGMERELSSRPRTVRGIAFAKGCLKLAELVTHGAPRMIGETGSAKFRVENWSITASSNDRMTASSWKDWKNDCTVQASDIAISDQMISEFRLLGVLLHQPRDSGAAAVQALQNLAVVDPVPSITVDGVVYLIARDHLKACVLAIDMRNNTVQGVGVAEFSTENESSEDVMYSPCTISSV